MRGYFAQVRRAGFDIGLSTGKLTKAMVDVLLTGLTHRLHGFCAKLTGGEWAGAGHDRALVRIASSAVRCPN